MTSLLGDRVAIVTGASGGIGAAVAESLAAAGATVVIHYASNRAKAEEVVRRIAATGGQRLGSKCRHSRSRCDRDVLRSSGRAA